MKTIASFVLIVACVLAITAAAVDLHCTAIRPSAATWILACSANRLEALARGA